MLATAADIVADPSAPDAFVEGIMEGKDWVWDGGILREKIAEKTYKTINTLVDQKQLDEHKLNLFNDFYLIFKNFINKYSFNTEKTESSNVSWQKITRNGSKDTAIQDRC